MVPRVLVGANYFRGEQLEYLGVPAVFREYIPRVLAVLWGSVLRIFYTSSISGFDTADNPVLAVLLLLILPVLTVFGPSVLLVPPALALFRPSVLLILQYSLTAHTPSTRSIQAFGTAHTPRTRSIQAFSTAHTPVLAVRNVLDTPEHTRSTKYTGSVCEVLITYELLIP